MRIRMLVEMPEGATRNGVPWPAKGEAVDLPTAEAAHLVAAGVAEEATDEDDAQAPAEAKSRRRKAADTEGEAP
ncbi:hypothetical protein CW362_16535 [Streptomyces populi]|uniref:Uncharacterized protein n=1 Tax=Streptomyces populi TaxID=2058924 RepID=A0A2I0SPK1_9ACTN|nr:hypothetical protein [Streptomyces populi]PKT71866.1 hypothetical protein CW362_16535 [Streptomyces populi]